MLRIFYFLVLELLVRIGPVEIEVISDLKFRNEFILLAIKLKKKVYKFMIPIALLK